jgi:sulfonate transport system substrate-binding protein
MWRLCTATVALAALGLAGSTLVARADDAKPTVIRVGIINASSSATLWALPQVAQKYSFEIQSVMFQRYSDARTALATGDIDVSNIGPQDIALALSQGVKSIVALAGTASGGNCMVVRKGEDIKDWPALRERTIGVGAGSISWLMFAASVQENNIDYGTLKTVNIVGGGTTYTKALQDKQIDMMVVWQPFCAQAVVGGYGQYPSIDHRKSLAVGNIDGILAASKGFMKKDPSAVDRLMQAYVELVTSFQADKHKWTEIYAEKAGIDPKIAEASVEQATLHYELSRAQMVRMAKFLALSGITTRDVSGEIPQYIDYSPLMKATGKTEAQLSGGD